MIYLVLNILGLLFLIYAFRKYGLNYWFYIYKKRITVAFTKEF
ncbi:hypothetical protein A1OE_686 [Candidatus Endolissoclinum faulkneri L2]|uniref:Uncharacterized protein n=1 Tax=Candidatus Endolissoclinum faulkneri L2 TaxID=1193729 RepID=K7YQP9_9PROT|nr:hypothetical protein A1OE_686 [Candidatus Endolissoclinum faulkneri L2]